MCRLFAAISCSSIDAQALLFSGSQSLFQQSRVDPKRKQGDGWGIGWFEAGRPKLLKSPKAIYKELRDWNLEGGKGSSHKKLPQPNSKSQIRRVHSRCVIGHVRWASNPLKLKRSELIGLEHTQPFTHGKYLFAHNGTLFIPKEVAAQLGPWQKYIKGINDSEVLFYWLLKHIARSPKSEVLSPRLRTSDIGRRVSQAILGLNRIWDACKKSYPIHRFPYHGLNWVLSDGRTLLAFCYADPRGFGKSKALCNSQEPYYQLRASITPSEALVASEPLDEQPSWSNFRHGELLIVRRQPNHLTLSRANIR